MKNLIAKFLFLFYKYYDKGSTKAVAYESAIMALMMMIFLNVFSILILTGITKTYFISITDNVIWKKYLIGFIIFIPFFFLIKRIFKKQNIVKIEMDKPAMRKGYFIIVCYIISSMLLLIWAIKND